MRMKHEPIASGKRLSVNLSIDRDVVVAAKEAGVNLSRVSEAALRAATKAQQDKRWQEENRGAFEYWNTWVEKHGLPLAKYRLF